MSLYVLQPDADEMDTIAGQRMGVGYVDSDHDYRWAVSTVQMRTGSLVFIATDGMTDQIGGPKKIAFGRRKAFETIVQHRNKPAIDIGKELQRTLAEWQGDQVRRDDLTLFCARLRNKND
jgi:serine phosphatase RsbU (regulator of sigma subunit)